MMFVVEMAIYYVFAMFLMCTDNLFWVKSSPEYKAFKRLKYLDTDSDQVIWVDGKVYRNKISYIFGYRIWSVLTDWRDITPAIIGSFLLALITNIGW